MQNTDLFTPGRIGDLDLPNRIVMAPMTRSRASAEAVPSLLAAEYYSQRATAGLIITEGTAPSAAGHGYARTPGIWSAEQIQAWTKTTDAVHAAGSKVYLQILHVGRIAHRANRLVDAPPVAPSAIRAKGKMWTDSQGMQDFDEPREITTAEIPALIEEFAQATRNALAAGFDGVELHAASGYLPMQFLSSGSNHRTDGYGGSSRNRVRFVVETLEAMASAAGSAARVGVKISPAMQFNDIQDDDPVETYTVLAEAISPLRLAYLHAMRSPGPANFMELLRPIYKGTVLAGGGFERESAQAALAQGVADFIVFGKFYIANPDLPARFAAGAPLAEADQTTFYTPGAKGYTDYPAFSA